YLGALCKIQGGDDLLLFEPLVDAELVPDVATPQEQKLLVELLFQLTLPLKGQIRRAENQDPLGEAPELQLPDEETRHHRLARAGVAGEQKADLRGFQQVIVNRLELVRQWVDPRDRETEVGVKLVSDAERVGLKAEAQEIAVAVVSEGRVLDLQPG